MSTQTAELSVAPLTAAEELEFEERDKRVANHLEGAALELKEIRDRRLYRSKYRTFEDYCQDRLGRSRHRVDQIIGYAEVVAVFGDATPTNGRQPTGPTKPVNERQARPLKGLPPAEQQAAFKEAVDTAPGGKVTARHVQATVARRKGETPTNGRHGDDPFAGAEPLTDGEGAAVPLKNDEAVAIFVGAGAVDEILNAFTQLTAKLNRLYEIPAGQRIAGVRQQIDAAVKQARSLVRDYRFHALCHECRGKPGGCTRCGKSGVVTLEQFKRSERTGK